jgi:hypothetical protein
MTTHKIVASEAKALAGAPSVHFEKGSLQLKVSDWSLSTS